MKGGRVSVHSSTSAAMLITPSTQWPYSVPFGWRFAVVGGDGVFSQVLSVESSVRDFREDGEVRQAERRSAAT